MFHSGFSLPGLILTILLILAYHSTYSQQHDAELISQQTIVEVNANRLVQTYDFEVRINNRSGDKYAEISIPYNKLNKLNNISASVFDNSGRLVTELKKSDITDKSAGSSMSLFEDTYVKEFKLRNHTYPYTLRYSFKMESNQFMFLCRWFPVLNYDIPTLKATLKLNIPISYHIRFRACKVESPKIDSLADRKYYTWQADYINTVEPENWSPSLQQFLPCIEVVPEKFVFEYEGQQSDWKSFGNWHLKLLQNLDDLPLSEKIKIHSLTEGIADKKEKIRKLYHYLQDETRYINVSIKTGGMKPYPASYVAEKKYGDCKALTNYFRSCLGEIGIDSYYSAVNAGDDIEPVDTAFAAQQFNHVFLCVPLDSDTLWLDCTSKLAFGYLGTFTQNRPALVLKKDASKLVMTPRLTENDVIEERKIKATIGITGEMKAVYDCNVRGEKYEYLSQLRSELSESERKYYLDKRFVNNGFLLESYEINIPQRDNPVVNLVFTATSSQMMKTYGNESLLKVIPVSFTFIEDPKKRKLPVQFNYPYARVDSCEYEIPANYKVSTIPDHINIESPFGSYTVSFQKNAQSVAVVKQIIIKAGTYQADQYPGFYNFINRISESEQSLYITLTNN